MDCKKILVAIDGSENSIRAISYVGQVLRSKEDFLIKLLYIERLPDRDLFSDDVSWKQRCVELRTEMRDFISDARDILESHGIPDQCLSDRYVQSCKSPFADRPETHCSHGTSIAQEILSILKEEGFGTVVVGRRGVSKAEEFLFGSVSSKIIHHAKGCSVWVVA
ncbi:MAG: universal stress protein [Desulfovibrionaceae bacterium]